MNLGIRVVFLTLSLIAVLTSRELFHKAFAGLMLAMFGAYIAPLFPRFV